MREADLKILQSTPPPLCEGHGSCRAPLAAPLRVTDKHPGTRSEVRIRMPFYRPLPVQS